MAQPFVAPPLDTSWFSVGLASSFLDIIGAEATALAKYHTESGTQQVGCKVFHLQSEDSRGAVQLSQNPENQLDASLSKGQQVLVFRYNGKFHAIDNKCPHASFPLSNATPFDIEDFGVTLSAGITCPQHDWSFDLFTGTSDRGKYKLKIWEVQLRPTTSGEGEDGELEVWVGKRQRMG
ncbi:hypothetical protein BDV96DRAFT_494919 [Lophiotrema nucula]|uniref:Rieske domain-containing protein n=1 Tax=Lophiotrema nucula TaxID=690887 RepID=A0A6A5Z5E2_9PLEO|nr:hypothetical protein BDV96DRAFT_494919 [Lophiotrema nucula]